MIRINLLPHRELRRKQQQQQFFVMLGTTVAVGIAIWFAVHTYFSEALSEQVNRNAYLGGEIAKLDKEIAEIKKLQEQTASLLARKRVVETLQANRAETVHLLDQLARQLPDGMYLRAIKQQGTRVTINGYTQSQARVSTLMRNLDASPHMENPRLVEIKAAGAGAARVSEFIMNIDISRPKAESSKPAAKPPVKKG
jgi:type IV pilus assembly protein PilN